MWGSPTLSEERRLQNTWATSLQLHTGKTTLIFSGKFVLQCQYLLLSVITYFSRYYLPQRANDMAVLRSTVLMRGDPLPTAQKGNVSTTSGSLQVEETPNNTGNWPVRRSAGWQHGYVLAWNEVKLCYDVIFYVTYYSYPAQNMQLVPDISRFLLRK